VSDTTGVLVMAYGGPDSLDDIEPYLSDVRGGRPVRAEMVAEMRERYRLIGGRSPILDRTRAQAGQLQHALDERNDALRFQCVVGMRHWTPRIATALAEMEHAGISRAVGLVMAPHYSRMSVGAYFTKVDEADSSVTVAPVERWHLMPELLRGLTSRVATSLDAFSDDIRNDVAIVFTAHSLPERIQEWDDPYPDELRATTDAVTQRLAASGIHNPYDFAYQSAAMTPDPWLGPDAGGVIERLHGEGVPGALIVPIGFTSDHVEILYDIDVEYQRLASRLGFALRRIDMVNDDPAIMAGLARVVYEAAGNRGWM
jgi:ferrochelatase